LPRQFLGEVIQVCRRGAEKTLSTRLRRGTCARRSGESIRTNAREGGLSRSNESVIGDSPVPLAAATSFIVRSERVPRHHRAHARRKFGKSKRLLDQVVRAATERADAFRDARATCENQDRQRLGSFAKEPQNRNAVVHRQVEIDRRIRDSGAGVASVDMKDFGGNILKTMDASYFRGERDRRIPAP